MCIHIYKCKATPAMDIKRTHTRHGIVNAFTKHCPFSTECCFILILYISSMLTWNAWFTSPSIRAAWIHDVPVTASTKLCSPVILVPAFRKSRSVQQNESSTTACFHPRVILHKHKNIQGNYTSPFLDWTNISEQQKLETTSHAKQRDRTVALGCEECFLKKTRSTAIINWSSDNFRERQSVHKWILLPHWNCYCIVQNGTVKSSHRHKARVKYWMTSTTTTL